MSSTAKGVSVSHVDLRVPAPPMRDDRGLARGAASGDRRAFEAIFRRHHRELYRYCRAILGDADEAQDALQSTMVKALRALPGERREIALKPWLFRVAHNEADRDPAGQALRRRSWTPSRSTSAVASPSGRRPASASSGWWATWTSSRSASGAR